MSKAKDRARAESGIIFRDGSYVNKEEWYAAHPTSEMLTQRQAETDKAVAVEMARKQKAKNIPSRYYCTACRKHHIKTSKVGKEHINFYLEEA